VEQFEQQNKVTLHNNQKYKKILGTHTYINKIEKNKYGEKNNSPMQKNAR
jgi:hypothetical protein